MQDLNDFAWFVQVVDHGGFASGGAERLTSRNPSSAAALRNSMSGCACV
jgi:hypothetical protein